MKLTPQQLPENGYELLDKLEHSQLVPFIKTYLKQRNKFTFLYVLSNLITVALSVYLFLEGFKHAGYNFESRFTHFSYGIGLAFVLVPLHEYIHVLAYRWQGAKNTSYAANLKRLYFMALADKFVANKKEFVIVALAPFTAISLSLLCLLPVVNVLWRLTIAGILFTHTAMCSGDFGLLSYLNIIKTNR